MSVHIVSEQTGLDGYWITDVLAGIKGEASKKNLKIEDFSPAMIEGGTEKRPIVLTVGYSDWWFRRAVHRLRECGAEPLLVNAGQDFCTELCCGAVGFDYKTAMDEVFSYLHSCGKKRLAFLGCGNSRLSFESKKKAFLSCARLAHFDCCDVFEGEDISSAVSQFMEQLLSYYDAVICSRDVEASHLFFALADRGMTVPEDMFVLSFGDSTMAKQLTPSLTAVRTDFRMLGEEAVKLSQFLKQNTGTSHMSTLVRCPLVVRDSTAAKRHLAHAGEKQGVSPVYKTDADYMSFLQAEELVRGWDRLDRSIVMCLAERLTCAAIAERLFISQTSVKYRIKKMLTNANIKNRYELIRIAQKYGLL